MIEIGYFMTIITLYKQGESQRKIAKLVGHDRKTVRRIIKLYKEKGVIEPIKKQKESTLDEYKELIIKKGCYRSISLTQISSSSYINIYV